MVSRVFVGVPGPVGVGMSKGDADTYYAPIDHTHDDGVVNVEDAGVSTGNTAAANTTAMNALFDDIDSGAETRRSVFVPDLYDINAALTPPRRNIRIFGLHRYLSGFVQTTANTPVLLWQDEGSDAAGLSDGIVVEHLGLHHATAPNAATTQQYGIQFRPTADGTSVSHKGYLGMRLHDLDIVYPYIGIGTYTASGGQCPIWMSSIKDIRMRGVKHHALLVASDGSVGSTDSVVDGLIVHNWYNSDAITNDGPAIKLKECNGWRLGTVNIESWHGLTVEANGCDNVLFDNLRLEWYATDTDYSRAVYLADGAYRVNGFHVNSIDKSHASGWFHLLTAGTGAKVAASTISVTTVTGSGPNTAVFEGSGGTFVVDTVDIPAGINEYLSSGNGDMLYGRVSVDGLPPVVDALPTPSATYRGRMFRVEGGAGAADAVSLCEKNAADTYAWRTI